MTSQPLIEGQCDPAFSAVGEAFHANFYREDDYRDVGAALCVYWRGRKVVNLWGGLADQATSRPWREDTLVNIWSATKGLTAVVIARLVERGLLSYEDKVADHWPEFAQAGKADIRVGDLLSHQSGLNGFLEPTTIEEFADWDLLTRRLAEQPPFWAPGQFTAYHAMTYGFLVGEVARRVTGLTPRELFRSELAQALGADVHLGLPPHEASRVATTISPDVWSTTPGAVDVIAEPATTNPAPRPDWANRQDWRDGQVPAANGHASAAGLAKIYAALANGGSLDGIDLLSPATIEAMRVVRSRRDDRMLGPRLWAAGMVLNRGASYGPNPNAYGHSGWGGSFGCADPDAGVGIGYVLNRMGSKVADDPRALQICQAVFECVGGTSA